MEVDMRQILEKVAQEFNMTVDEMHESLQAVLNAAFDAQLSPQAQRVFEALYHDGKAPTPEEFFAAYFEAMRREKEAGR